MIKEVVNHLYTRDSQMSKLANSNDTDVSVCHISSKSALFAKTKTIFRERSICTI